MNNLRFNILAGMVLAVVVTRLLPHPPNFTPVAAIALFGGASFSKVRAAFFVPLLGLLLSDLVLGFSMITPVVYACFALITCIGLSLRQRQSVGSVTAAAVMSVLLFFVLSNFGTWCLSGLYPKTGTGLLQCYTAALPFMRNMLTSTLLYTALLFGGLALAERRFAGLREPGLASA